MDCFIKKMFDHKVDDLVHLQFEKYSRGEYKDKAVVVAKNSKGNYSISTTAEYANELVRMLAEKLGSSRTKVTGVIVSTRDLSAEIKYSDIKQFMGIKQYVIDSEMSGNEMIQLCQKLPRAFFGLSFKVGDTELKIKPKAPKSAKPSTSSQEKIKADFCKIKTSDKNLIHSFIFDLGDFKAAEIKHTFLIKDIELPKGIEDPLKMREMAIRKGTLIRMGKIDGKEHKREVEFAV